MSHTLSVNSNVSVLRSLSGKIQLVNSTDNIQHKTYIERVHQSEDRVFFSKTRSAFTCLKSNRCV